MRPLSTLIAALLLVLCIVSGQQYQNYEEDYSQDNLYHDYAMRQQQKETTKGGSGIRGWIMGAGLGWFLGAKFHCRRVNKKLNAKHKSEQKALYTQYYNDVYALQEQNEQLLLALEQLGVKTR